MSSWRLHPVDDSQSASCLPDLIHSTYVLVMPGLLNEMAHRPHGLLEVTQGDICHVRATVLPPRINLPILQEFLKAFCRRGWPMVRCVGTHNQVPLTMSSKTAIMGFLLKLRSQELSLPMQWTSPGGVANRDSSCIWTISTTRAIPTSSWWVSPTGEPSLPAAWRRVGVIVSRGMSGSSWSCAIDTLLYVALRCTPMQRTPPSVTWMRAMTQGAPWCPAAIACRAVIEQLGLFVACQQRRRLPVLPQWDSSAR